MAKHAVPTRVRLSVQNTPFVRTYKNNAKYGARPAGLIFSIAEIFFGLKLFTTSTASRRIFVTLFLAVLVATVRHTTVFVLLTVRVVVFFQ